MNNFFVFERKVTKKIGDKWFGSKVFFLIWEKELVKSMNRTLHYYGYCVGNDDEERASLPVLGSQYFSTSMEILEYQHGVTGVTTMRDRRSTEQQSPTHHEEEDSEKACRRDKFSLLP